MRARLTLVMVFALALAACAGVLGLNRRTASHPFEHRAHVDKGINCLECHVGADVAGDTGPVHFPTDADCRRCHSKPHDEHPCAGCHGESYVRSGVELAKEHLRFEHGKHVVASRRRLRPLPHGGGAGAAAGDRADDGDLLRLPRAPGPVDDARLRRVPRRPRSRGNASRPTTSCTTATSCASTASGRRARAILCASCHSERSCAACHGVGTVPALPARLAFDDVQLSGLHRAGFLARHSEEARADTGLCTTCHSEQSCIDCHTRENIAPGTTTRSPHPAGWITTAPGGGDHGVQARIDPVSCAGCHGGAGEQLCVGCHRVGGPGGNPHGRGFSSTKNKVHDMPCRECHAP